MEGNLEVAKSYRLLWLIWRATKDVEAFIRKSVLAKYPSHAYAVLLFVCARVHPLTTFTASVAKSRTAKAARRNISYRVSVHPGVSTLWTAL